MVVRYLKESFSSKVTNSWQYRDIIDYGYTIKLHKVDRDKSKLIIYFPDGDVYATFQIEKYVTEDFEDIYSIYEVYEYNNTREDITDEVDFALTFDECVVSCLNYFVTRY